MKPDSKQNLKLIVIFSIFSTFTVDVDLVDNLNLMVLQEIMEPNLIEDSNDAAS